LILKRSLVCFAISLLVGPVWADSHATLQPQYLALGDSLAFGYNPLVQPANLNQYVGYPRIIAGLVGVGLANASCPGETTSTFIGTSTAFYPPFNCVTMQQQNQLYVSYNGAPNQLAYAVQFLTANPNTKLVTIDIGVNDLALLELNCSTQFAGNPTAITNCELSGLPGTLTTIGQNLSTIFAGLRGTGYKGLIVALDGFPSNYNDAVEVGGITAFNTLVSQVAAPYGVTMADLYVPFQNASTAFGGDTCAAGLLITLSPGTCDTHPDVAGQTLISSVVLQTIEVVAHQ
jgi:lysophospholipase L1-like esterase